MPKPPAVLADPLRIESPPPLRTGNGLGFRLSGWFRDPELDPLRFSAHWFVIFFIPIIPIAIYLIDGGIGPGSTYRFYGRMPIGKFIGRYGVKGLKLVLWAYLEGIMMLAALAIAVSIAGTVVDLLHRR